MIEIMINPLIIQLINLLINLLTNHIVDLMTNLWINLNPWIDQLIIIMISLIWIILEIEAEVGVKEK